MVKVTLWDEIIGVGVTFFVVMDCPPIKHDDRVFRKEMSFIPIVFNEMVVHSKFIGGSPSEQF